jgi:hypothetical protein
MMYGTFPKHAPFEDRYVVIETDDPKNAMRMFIQSFGPGQVDKVWPGKDKEHAKNLTRLCNVYEMLGTVRTKNWDLHDERFPKRKRA